jgi:hypothetical protein
MKMYKSAYSSKVLDICNEVEFIVYKFKQCLHSKLIEHRIAQNHVLITIMTKLLGARCIKSYQLSANYWDSTIFKALAQYG